MKLLLTLVLIGIVYFFARGMFKQFENKKKHPQNKEKMVNCIVCDVYLPESESLIHNGQYYCSHTCQTTHME